ncbi:ABC transporter ATP-binding protein [Rhizobium rhizogenes]|uniref:ABC transporter ATP-binding protein n=1 Tax=Rhizobium rhizogenes TaxID=359 RepID=UPI001574537D|nr:ABC transporter ATP-binding protein [Rhizobium rhizogenes]NTF89526.1 ABC transporter ATP-binding protein [Rhizobium rhizogenes]
MSDPLLSIRGLQSRYGDFQALFDVSFELEPGTTLALIGANGAGKSTLLKTVVGLLSSRPNMVTYRGEAIGGIDTSLIVRRGIGLVPEGRQLFPSLSVEENLMIGKIKGRSGDWNINRVYKLFPVLEEKRKSPATMLSGGQQQMVAIGRTLMGNPDIIMMDEISLGLAPVVIKTIYQALPDIIGTGVSAIIVEQDIGRALSVANSMVCLQKGRVSLAGRPSDFSRRDIVAAYFGA